MRVQAQVPTRAREVQLINHPITNDNAFVGTVLKPGERRTHRTCLAGGRGDWRRYPEHAGKPVPNVADTLFVEPPELSPAAEGLLRYMTENFFVAKKEADVWTVSAPIEGYKYNLGRCREVAHATPELEALEFIEPSKNGLKVSQLGRRYYNALLHRQ